MASNASITGKVVNAASGQPIEFVSVVLVKSDGTIIKKELTSVNGLYQFTNFADGTYYIVASFVGFDNFKSANLIFAINKTNHILGIGLISKVTRELDLLE